MIWRGVLGYEVHIPGILVPIENPIGYVPALDHQNMGAWEAGIVHT